MSYVTLEDFAIPETCGQCKFVGHYKYGAYSCNPHYCCELMYFLKEDDYKVDENSIDEECPLKIINSNI